MHWASALPMAPARTASGYRGMFRLTPTPPPCGFCRGFSRQPVVCRGSSRHVLLSRGPPASLCDRGSSGQPAVPGDTTPQTKTGGGIKVQKMPPSTRGRPVCRWQVSAFRTTDALATQEGFYKQRGRPRWACHGPAGRPPRRQRQRISHFRPPLDCSCFPGLAPPH